LFQARGPAGLHRKPFPVWSWGWGCAN